MAVHYHCHLINILHICAYSIKFRHRVCDKVISADPIHDEIPSTHEDERAANQILTTKLNELLHIELFKQVGRALPNLCSHHSDLLHPLKERLRIPVQL